MEVRPEGERKAGFTEVAAVWKLHPKVSGGQTSLLRRRGGLFQFNSTLGLLLFITIW